MRGVGRSCDNNNGWSPAPLSALLPPRWAEIAPQSLLLPAGLLPIYCQLKNGTFSFPPSFHFQPAYCTAIKALSQILHCCKIVGILAEYFST